MTELQPVATTDRNFILQQGLDASDARSCSRVSSALLFQPRLVGLIVLVGTITQSPAVFVVLAGLLWWCSLVPRLNPFDLAYNRTFGLRSKAPVLGAAPLPRRFAQGMAATFATAIAAGMAADFWVLAWILEGLFILAVAALAFGRFCLGSFVYHLVRGRVAFAMSTLPWGRGA